MSFIGKLEQLDLSLILQGIETYAKTGLLVIKQEELRIELYFRDGRLMCIGPVRPDTTLGDRLLQAGVISAPALQETLSSIGTAQHSETRIALTLMDLGYVNHEGLRNWAAQEAVRIIHILLTWKSGEIFFEDGQQPPTDRLLVSLSPSSLLPSVPVAAPVQQVHVQSTTPPVVYEQQRPTLAAPPPATTTAPQQVNQVQSRTTPFGSPESSMTVPNVFKSSDVSMPPLTPPQRLPAPPVPVHIDTSFMRPEMVLLPLDLSALRDKNPQLQITSDQWRLLTRVDGRTVLQSICQELAMTSNQVCQLAGELIALGLVQVSMPVQQASLNELSPVSRDLIVAGLANGHVSPGYAANAAPPWAAIAPTTTYASPSYSSSIPFETRSQWGNGGNGANFVPGRGWVATPQPLQPLQPSGPLYSTHGIYAPMGGRR